MTEEEEWENEAEEWEIEADEREKAEEDGVCLRCGILLYKHEEPVCEDCEECWASGMDWNYEEKRWQYTVCVRS